MAESRELDLEPLLKITKEFEGVWGKALGRDLYHLCSALMPSLNVDIMLKSADGILLSWRDDEYYGWLAHARQVLDTKKPSRTV